MNMQFGELNVHHITKASLPVLPSKSVGAETRNPNPLCSLSDMSLRIWDFSTDRLMTRFDHHSEFVLGVDFSLFNEGQIASCSWDELVCVMRY